MSASLSKSKVPSLFILLLLFLSCKDSDEQIDPVKDPESCFLKRVVSTDATSYLTYNSADQVIQIRSDYVSGHPSKISLIEHDDRGNIIKISEDYGYLEYEYDLNNRVISGKIYYRTDPSQPFKLRQSMRYTYNNRGLMDSAIYADKHAYNRYEYDAQGYLSKVFTNNFELSEKMTGEVLKFDDKPILFATYFSHYTIVSGSAIITLVSLRLPQSGPHNIESERVLLTSGNWDTRNYTYTYNELGYPVTRTMTATRALSPAEKAGLTYVYDCR